MENSRFKCIHQYPKHSVFQLASCPSASNWTLMWCANWKMFCLFPAQLLPTFFLWVFSTCLSSQAVSSWPLQASAGIPWVAVEISTKILSPKYRGIRREGFLCPKGWICDQKAEWFSLLWVEGLPNHCEDRGGVWWCRDCLGVEVVGTGAVGLFALISGEEDLQEGSLSHKKIAFAGNPVRNYHKSQCAVKSSSFPPSCCHFLIYRAFPKNLSVVPLLCV